MKTQAINIKILYKVGAFSPGSSLWIIPQLNTSPWSQKINWYLNFQISKIKFLKPKDLSLTLKKTMKENTIEPFNLKLLKNQSPLLIFSHSFLPNTQTIELPDIKTHKKWIELAYKIWSQLNFPSLRLFLSRNFPISEFQDLWPEKNQRKKEVPITLVPHLFEEKKPLD